jgi:transmembrane sensor
MNELIIKYISEEISEEEKQQLFSLLESDEEIRKEFLSSVNLRALTSWQPTDNDMSEGIDKLMAFKNRHAKKHRIIQLMRYAAVACIIILGSVAIFHKPHTIPYESANNYEEIYVPSGQRAQLKLHDGTIIWLNANSHLRYPSRFANSERKVELNGEAYFEVAKNKECPFIVSTYRADIKVLGTKFNVFAYNDSHEFSTSLMEGSIKLYNPANESHSIYMKPNEEVEYRDGHFVKNSFSNSDFLSWKDGIYSFDNMPFGEIVKKLEIYYDVKIEVKSSRLKAFKFSGKFRQIDGVESILRIIQKVHPLVFYKNDKWNRIIIE